MSGSVITTTEDEDVDDVLRRMRQFAVRRMPVVDARDLVVGMVTVDDVLDRLAEEVSEVVAIVRRERSVSTGSSMNEKFFSEMRVSSPLFLGGIHFACLSG